MDRAEPTEHDEHGGRKEERKKEKGNEGRKRTVGRGVIRSIF